MSWWRGTWTSTFRVSPSASDPRFLPGRILGWLEFDQPRCAHVCAHVRVSHTKCTASQHVRLPAGRRVRKSFVFPTRPGMPSSLQEAFQILGEEQPPASEVPGAFLSWSISQSHFFTPMAPHGKGRQGQSEHPGGADRPPALPLSRWENWDKLFNFSEPQCPYV